MVNIISTEKCLNCSECPLFKGEEGMLLCDGALDITKNVIQANLRSDVTDLNAQEEIRRLLWP